MHPQLDNRLRSKLRLRHFELLDALGDTLNIRKAAPRLHLSQSSATKLLQEIEALYKTLLFERLPRGLRLTSAGEAVVSAARMLLHHVGDSVAEAHSIAAGSSGRVRVGVLSVAIPSLLADVLQRVRAEMPDLVISVTEGANETLHSALARNELDLVVGRLTGGAHVAPLAAEALYEESVSLVVRKNHPLLRVRKLTLKNVAGVNWLLPPELSPLRQQLDLLMLEQGLPRLQAKLETTSLLLAEVVLNQSGMVGAMPASVARHYKSKGNLEILKLRLPLNMPPVGVIFNTKVLRSPVVNTFIDLLKQTAAQRAASD